MIRDFNQQPVKTVRGSNRDIHIFNQTSEEKNIDEKVVESFGDEWTKFYNFNEKEIRVWAEMNFDILEDKMLNKDSYAIDLGCGTGRFTKYLLPRLGFMEAIDPSNAIYTADKLLGDAPNVRLSQASIDNIPFADETFDFGMSIGVLHHIPDTQKAMIDCVKKIKIGGYFYTYLYYNLENRGLFFKFLFSVAGFFRKIISSLPLKAKKIICDILAVVFYMPFILLGRLLKKAGLGKLASKLPLAAYQGQTFFVIRNDSLDRFGTKLEHRFSKQEVVNMMANAGLVDIIVSNNLPLWHAIGKRAK